MKNIIGVVTSTYPQYVLEDAAKGVSGAGFGYIEIISAPAYFSHIKPNPEVMTEEDAGKILELCEKYGLKIHCVGGHTRLLKENSVNGFKKVIDAARLFGANFVTTDAGEVKTKEDQKKFYEDITIIAEYARSSNVTICLEMHGVWCNTGKKGAEIIEKINHPNVRLNYDTGNVILYGNTRPEGDIENALPYMAFIHLKEHGSGKFGEWNFPALGDGVIDFKKILGLIKDYEGPMSVEIEFEGKEHTLEEINRAVSKSYDFLKTYGYVK